MTTYIQAISIEELPNRTVNTVQIRGKKIAVIRLDLSLPRGGRPVHAHVRWKKAKSTATSWTARTIRRDSAPTLARRLPGRDMCN